MPQQLLIFLLTDDATAPRRATFGSAGYDLYSAQETVVPAGGKKVVMTDVALILPDGCYGRVAPRSGLAVRNHIDVGAGVIDPDYRGNVGVVLFNFGSEDFKVAKGDRIAQLVLEKYVMADTVVLIGDPLTNEELRTGRGNAGFGHTGRGSLQ